MSGFDALTFFKRMLIIYYANKNEIERKLCLFLEKIIGGGRDLNTHKSSEFDMGSK